MSKKSFKIRKPKLTIEQLYNQPLSKTIMVAVKDLQTNLANGAIVNMADWGRRNGECVGCFAGHCLLPYTKDVMSLMRRNKYASEIGSALNSVRCGDLESAINILYENITNQDLILIRKIDSKNFVAYWNTYDFKFNPKMFFKNMGLIADALKKAGF